MKDGQADFGKQRISGPLRRASDNLKSPLINESIGDNAQQLKRFTSAANNYCS